jgi:salicylate hydroxylase
MHVIIVGGGLGGATAALALSRRGIKVTLLEQAAALTEVGAGIQVGANGSRVLRHLGVIDAFEKRAVHAQSYRIVNFETGELIHDHPLGAQSAAHYGSKAYEVHRADTLDVLVEALPADTVRTGCKAVSVSQNETEAIVTLESGEQIRGDVVIGADGVHSAVRHSLFGEVESIFSGYAAWRSLLPASAIAELDLDERFRGWRGSKRIAVTYWVRSKELFNFVGFVPVEELGRESWSQRGKHEELVRAMEGCEPLLQKLVERASDAFITVMYYRKALPRWSIGRVSLMGDAAHAMLPYMAQGAVQSMEDGLVLAGCLAKAERGEMSPQAALLDYEARRRPRTTRVQRGVLALRKFWFASDPIKRQGEIRRMQAQDVMDPMAESQWAWVYHYDAGLESEVPLGYSAAMPVSRAEHELVWPRLADKQSWDAMFSFDDYSDGCDGMRQGWEHRFANAISAQALTLGGVACLQVEAPQAAQRVIVHMHGGGYIMGSARAALPQAQTLAEQAQARVICVDYRLAPEYPYPAPVEDLLAVYQALLQSGVCAQDIFFSGESSGAAIALAALMTLRDQGQPLPRALAAVSPYADMTLSGESTLVNGFADEFLNRDMLLYMGSSYCQREPAASPGVSPVFGDFKGLPPMLLLAGRREALTSDAIRIARQAREAGGFARVLLADTSTHGFTQFEDEKAREPALALIANFIIQAHSAAEGARRFAFSTADYPLINQL